MADTFKNEAEFEAALVNRLKDFGWSGWAFYTQPDEQELLDNWAHNLYKVTIRASTDSTVARSPRARCSDCSKYRSPRCGPQ